MSVEEMKVVDVRDVIQNKGLTPKQYADILDYLQKNNGWKGSYERDIEFMKNRPFIKYITAHFDTRDGTIWSVVIQDGERIKKAFQEEDLTISNIMEYLNSGKGKYREV